MSHSSHTDAAPPLKMGLKLPNSKLCMWLFLGTEIMFFTALIGTYIVLRLSSIDVEGNRAWPTNEVTHIVTWAGALTPKTQQRMRVISIITFHVLPISALYGLAAIW